MSDEVRQPWLVLVGLSFGVCISNGFARFAYGLILPAMRDDLSWTYAEAGWINTANALGYIVGAVGTFALVSRVSPARLFRPSVVATSVFVLLSGLTADFFLLTLWRVMAGVFGAPVFIAGGALAASLFGNDGKRNALGIALYFGGGGLGMVLSGAALPWLFATTGNTAWPAAWIALGTASLVACPLCLWGAAQFRQTATGVARAERLPLHHMRFELAGYGLFAMGYIVYLTFLGAWMANLNAEPVVVSAVWIVAGIAIMLSPFVWKSVLAQFDSGVPLAAATATVAIGTVLPIVFPSSLGLILSAILFGIALFIGPGAVTSFSRKNLPQASWGRAVGMFTAVFAIGQTVGPVAAGVIGDVFGGIEYGLLAAGILLLLGAVVALLQRPLVPDERGAEC